MSNIAWLICFSSENERTQLYKMLDTFFFACSELLYIYIGTYEILMLMSKRKKKEE
jgi:hypothetical protein